MQRSMMTSNAKLAEEGGDAFFLPSFASHSLGISLQVTPEYHSPLL